MKSQGRTARAMPISALGLIVVLTLLAGAPIADGQSASDVRRIGYLSNTTLTGNVRFLGAFVEGLRDRGWIEGRNLVIEYRWAEGRPERLSRLADELVRLKVDVIVTLGTPPSVAAKNATQVIPIVMVSAADPVRLGLVASLGRPGGNVTGTSFDVGLEVFGKQLELFKEALPKLRRVAILSNAGNPAQEIAVGNVKVAAQSLGLQLQHLPVHRPTDFDAAFGAMRNKHADGLLVLVDAFFQLHRARLADLAAKNRLPSMFGFREFVDAGGLMSYGPSASDIFWRAAGFVDRILKGARPGDLPVEQPTRFELVINLQTAKALGLSVPQPLLLRADQVVE
jgi:putative tryptophan/tyrosine transport system substrate-binding protein